MPACQVRSHEIKGIEAEAQLHVARLGFCTYIPRPMP